jgi:hypothetical protein
MFTTRQVQRREIAEVFLSNERVVASEVQSVIPEGYRQATLEEVTLRYIHDANFRDRLWEGPAWISQKGLDTSGLHEISDDGKHISTTESIFYNVLTPERRSIHCEGSGPVVGYVDDLLNDRERALGFDADTNTFHVARVAYVKDGHEVATPQATPGVVIPTVQQFDAAKDVFRP